MKKIDDVNLGNMVAAVSHELVVERRKQAEGIIKKELQRMEGLVTDIKRCEKELKLKQGKLAKAQEKIDRVSGGDWQALTELEGQKEDVC